MAAAKEQVALPGELIEEIDAFMGAGSHTAFIVEAAR